MPFVIGTYQAIRIMFAVDIVNHLNNEAKLRETFRNQPKPVVKPKDQFYDPEYNLEEDGVEQLG